MYWRFITIVSTAAALVVTAGGCRKGPPRAPAIAEAYVGPAALKIRGDIPLESAPVAMVKHGDRLEIIGRRRKFFKVRTASGAEGWTDERQLLAASDMDELRDLATRAAKMPSQGVATTYRDLNVHTQPSTSSPSFLRLKEGEKFDVLAQVVTEQTDTPRKPLVPPAEKKKALPKKPKKEPKIPPPPLPAPPPLPSNWLDLSRTELDEDEDAAPEPEAKPIPTASWSLIRTHGGQSGWALTRFVSMAIPDEVAQYAEGARIVSYASLGSVQDGDQKKPIWLWTTIRGRQPWDFESFRVFIWSLKRHRYETAYIERSVQGYWPVVVNEVNYSGGRGDAGKYPGFSMCLQKADGQRVRREYAMMGNVVRFAGERPCESTPPLWVAKGPEGRPTVVIPEVSQTQPSAVQRWKEKVKGWFHRGAKEGKQ